MSDIDWIYWSDAPPPKDAKVIACWSITEEPIEVTTCRNGCCVYGVGGTLILPNWWKPVAASEIERQP